MVDDLDARIQFIPDQFPVFRLALFAMRPHAADEKQLIVLYSTFLEFLDQHAKIKTRFLPSPGDIGDDDRNRIARFQDFIEAKRIDRMV